MINRFPGLSIRTIDSCSGHINPDGSLHYQKGYIEKEGMPQTPHIILTLKVDPSQFEESVKKIRELLDPVFENSIELTNQSFDREVLTLEVTVPTEPIVFENENGGEIANADIIYRTQIDETEYAKTSFPIFWEKIEQQLTNFDGMEMHSEFSPESFTKGR